MGLEISRDQDKLVRELEALSPEALQERIESVNRRAIQAQAAKQALAGDWATAASLFEAALEVGRSEASDFQALGQCYEKLGRWRAAADTYEKGLKNDYNAMQLHLGLGRMRIRLLQLMEPGNSAIELAEQAEQSFRIAVALDPANAEALQLFGMSLGVQGEFEYARALLEPLQKLDASRAARLEEALAEQERLRRSIGGGQTPS